jgi:hypothetical protein
VSSCEIPTQFERRVTGTMERNYVDMCIVRSVREADFTTARRCGLNCNRASLELILEGGKRVLCYPIVMSFTTAVAPGVDHAVIAARSRSCGVRAMPVSRTVPPCAVAVMFCGSDQER